MTTVTSLIDKARQCRRLSRTICDERTVRMLTTFAEECEKQARAMESGKLSSQADAPEGDLGERH